MRAKKVKTHKCVLSDHDNCRFQSVLFVIKSLTVGTKCVFKHQDLQRIDLKLNKYE